MAEEMRKVRTEDDVEKNINLAILSEVRDIRATVDDMQKRFNDLPCKVNTFKIGLLQKVVFGAIALILIAFMANLTTKVEQNCSATKPAVNQTKVTR